MFTRRALGDVHLRQDLRLQARLCFRGGHEEVFLVGGEGGRHRATSPASSAVLGRWGVDLPDYAVFFFFVEYQNGPALLVKAMENEAGKLYV